jgi:hypothetical protein
MKMRDTGEEPMKGGGRHRGRHARGGHAKEHVNEYNAKGSPEVHEAEDKDDEFSHGGRKKRAAGGIAAGVVAPARGDKSARGRAAGGKTPSPPKLADGGKPAKLRRGGHAEEEREERKEEREHHAGGGRAGRGNSPWSSGSKLSAPERDKSGNKEGISVAAED